MKAAVIAVAWILSCYFFRGNIEAPDSSLNKLTHDRISQELSNRSLEKSANKRIKLNQDSAAATFNLRTPDFRENKVIPNWRQ